MHDHTKRLPLFNQFTRLDYIEMLQYNKNLVNFKWNENLDTTSVNDFLILGRLTFHNSSFVEKNRPFWRKSFKAENK